MSLIDIYAPPPDKPTLVAPEGGFRDNSWYVVRVSFRRNNPVHRAILYTGLGATGTTFGSYAYLTSPGYDSNHHFARHGQAHYLAVEKELGALLGHSEL